MASIKALLKKDLGPEQTGSIEPAAAKAALDRAPEKGAALSARAKRAPAVKTARSSEPYRAMLIGGAFAALVFLPIMAIVAFRTLRSGSQEPHAYPLPGVAPSSPPQPPEPAPTPTPTPTPT